MSEIKKAPKLNSLLAQKDPEIVFVEPDEWYVAEFEEAKIEQGKFGPYIRFMFRLLSGDKEDGTSAKGVKITRIMDCIIAPSKPLWKWASVFLDREPKIDEAVDLTAFYGEKYRVLIKDRPRKTDDAKRYQTIDTIKKREKKVKEEE